MIDRRDVLAAAAAAAMARPAGAATSPSDDGAHPYDYLFVEVPRRGEASGGPAPFLAHLRGAGGAAVTAAGGEVLGHFAPLIGWSSEQLAVMIRWPGATPDRERALDALLAPSLVRSVERGRLAPTLRPAPADRPRTGGIYTHRWFEIRREDLAEFVALSGRAWPEFERDFDAAIFGLFRALPDGAEARRGTVRMLLNTWYASHAVWEASRTPSPLAADAFRRREAMTLTTRVVSLRFTPFRP